MLSVRLNLELAARARSTKQPRRLRFRQRGRAVGRLAGNAQRFPAAGEDLELGALVQQVIRQPRTGFDEVLAVIQDQQRFLVPQVIHHLPGKRRHGHLLQPKHLRHGRDDLRRIGQRRQLHQPDTLRDSRPSSCAPTSWVRRVLPVPPEPVSVTRRAALQQLLDLVNSFSRPMKVVNCTGRLLGKVRSDLRAGKSCGSSGN